MARPLIGPCVLFGASLPAILVLIRQSAPLNMHLLGGIMDSAGTGSHFHPIDQSSHRKKKNSRFVQQFPLKADISHIFNFRLEFNNFFFYSRKSSSADSLLTATAHKWVRQKREASASFFQSCRLVFYLAKKLATVKMGPQRRPVEFHPRWMT